MRALVMVLLAGLLAGLFSCRTLTPPAQGTKLTDKTYWLNYDATRRGGFVTEQDSKERFLSEPAPDVALESVISLIAEVDGQSLTAEAQETIVELGKRTAAVMILREALYRLGEMKINGTLDADAKELYGRIIDATVLIAAAEAASAVSELEPEVQERMLQGFQLLQQ